MVQEWLATCCNPFPGNMDLLAACMIFPQAGASVISCPLSMISSQVTKLVQGGVAGRLSNMLLQCFHQQQPVSLAGLTMANALPLWPRVHCMLDFYVHGSVPVMASHALSRGWLIDHDRCSLHDQPASFASSPQACECKLLGKATMDSNTRSFGSIAKVLP